MVPLDAPRAPPSAGGRPPPGAADLPLELRLDRDRVQVRLAGEPLADGAAVTELLLDVPGGAGVDVTFGPAQFRSWLCDLDRLELEIAPPALEAAARAVALRAAFRAGFVELAGAVEGIAAAPGEPQRDVAFTAKLAALPPAEAGLRLAIYEPRLYGRSALSAPALARRLAALVAPLVRGRAHGAIVELDPVRPLLLALLPRRGWKLPRTTGVQAVRAQLSPSGARLLWSRWDPPDDAVNDADLRACAHGVPAFVPAETFLAEGNLEAARDAWQALPPGARAHPFAAARTLGFLAAEPTRHGDAVALARAALERDESFAPAIAAHALVALARGDLVEASQRWSALARLAARRGEGFSALGAAEACAACGESADPAALAAALEAALSQDRTALHPLVALRALAVRTDDRPRRLRACRGLAAFAPTAAEKAAAHRELAELLAASDPAAARLHEENARRLAAG